MLRGMLLHAALLLRRQRVSIAHKTAMETSEPYPCVKGQVSQREKTGVRGGVKGACVSERGRWSRDTWHLGKPTHEHADHERAQVSAKPALAGRRESYHMIRRLQQLATITPTIICDKHTYTYV